MLLLNAVEQCVNNIMQYTALLHNIYYVKGGD